LGHTASYWEGMSIIDSSQSAQAVILVAGKLRKLWQKRIGVRQSGA
jgi:hypothetical protein